MKPFLFFIQKTIRKLYAVKWARYLLGILVLFVVLDALFPPKTSFAPDEFSSVVTDRQGYPLYAELSPDEIWRYPTNLESVSPAYIETVLAYEDRWFYDHPGINPIAMLRAAWQNLYSGEVISGASTLTMQVARLMHPYEQRAGGSFFTRLPGKIYQIARAIQLEVHLSKREILELYINSAPFGGVIEGIEAASYSYLQKSAAQLTDAESAMLAAMPQAPSRYRPDRYPEAALMARNKVIERMVDQGDWDRERADMALLETVDAFTWERPSLAPLLSRRLISEQSGTAKQLIHSSIDSEIQQELEQLVRQYVQPLPKAVSAAAILVDNSTLEVLAYVGSADYTDTQRYGYVDMIQAVRSPGSTLKPFLYAKALDQGLIHSASLMVDADRTSKSYRPANFDRGFNGPVTATDALQWSLNVPAVNLLESYGTQRFASELKNAGVQLYFPNGASPNLSMILGGVGIKMDNLTSAYAALSRGGISQPLQFYTDLDQSESIPEENMENPRYLVSPGAAWITYKILESHLQPGEISRQQINSRQDFAWKTGTSYGYRDAWAFAVNKAFTIGIWVGRPDGTPSPGQYGTQTAAPMLFNVMDMLQSGRANPLPAPRNVESKEICWPLGQWSESTPENFCHQTKQAWTLDGQTPPTSSITSNFDSEGAKVGKVLLTPDLENRTSRECHPRAVQAEFALWPIEAEPWLTPDLRRAALFPPVDKNCAGQATQSDQVQILFPESGSQFISHGNQPLAIPISASSVSGTQYWYVNGQHRSTIQANTTAQLDFEDEGRYRIQVYTETAQSRVIEISVAKREVVGVRGF